MNRLRFALPLLLFAVLAALLWRSLSQDTRALPSPLIGKPVPAFALPRLDDSALQLRADDLRGRPWLLNVWASWCVSCRDEHALLIEWARTQPVPLVGLNHRDAREPALDWLRRHGDPYAATGFDADGSAGSALGVRGVPETFVIDHHGVVRLRHAGPLTREVLDQRIRPLLKALDG